MFGFFLVKFSSFGFFSNKMATANKQWKGTCSRQVDLSYWITRSLVMLSFSASATLRYRVNPPF
jgi:hypothetical protein